MYEREYFSGDDVTESDLDAAERGELIAWRIAADGTQWYRRAGRSMIMGVPTNTVADFEDAGDDDPVADQDDNPVADGDPPVEGFAPINYEFGEGAGDDLDD
jgi:hypothetical protein